MHTLDTHQSSTTPGIPTKLRATVVLAALFLAACSPRSSDAKVADAGSRESRHSESAKGSGHLHITGDIAKDADFGIDGCQIGKPGDGLLDGYRMHAEGGDSSIIMLSVLLRGYTKDGSYTADTSGAAQLKEGMSSGNFSSLSLMVAGDGAANPLAFKLTPSSSLVITISDNGSSGKAEIVKMESQVGMSEMIAARNTNGSPHGKTISGFVTWSCGHVDQLNGEMNKAVDEMMNKIMPNH